MLERYYAAVEADHDYLEAWTQIGSIHAAKGELEIGNRRRFNRPHRACRLSRLAGTRTSPTSLCNSDGPTKLAAHWRKTEDHRRGPWAEQARQRLKAMDETPWMRHDS